MGKIYNFFITVEHMTYCKQGEIWLLDDQKYIILSDDRYNKRLGSAVCMRLVNKTTNFLDRYVPVFSRTIQEELWADTSSICMLNTLQERLCRISRMRQIREILRNFSRYFGSMCYVPVFGYTTEEYISEKPEDKKTKTPPKKTNDDDKGWVTVKYRK
tara:strand:- start:28 stop:501 length:474 start_codon:yes stop_codon:yes gene_type:complete